MTLQRQIGQPLSCFLYCTTTTHSYIALFMSFQLSFKRGAVRRKRGRAQSLTTSQQPSVAAAFGPAHDSDDSEDEPRAQKVTKISATMDKSASDSPPKQQKEEPVGNLDEKKTGPKASQIASMVERRKKANLESAGSREQRDEALFKYEVANCPDEADIHLYEKRPVDGFGAMMLRNMGWSGKETLEVKYEPPVPRPSRLGLGAKASTSNNQTRAKRLKEAEKKVRSTLQASRNSVANENGEGVTVDRETIRSDLNALTKSKRQREEGQDLHHQLSKRSRLDRQ